MNIQITGRHLDITDAIRTFVEKKFAKLEKHFDHITRLQVILAVEKGEHKAEASLQVPGSDLFAHSNAPNLYTAIDLLMEKVDRQLVKFKEKLKAHPHERIHVESDDALDTEAEEGV